MSQPPKSRRLAGRRGWSDRRPPARHRRLLVEGLERRELLAGIRGDGTDADLFSGHSNVCNCPICTGEGLAPVVPLIGYATAPGLASALTSLPQLRSNPSATAKLFLDFDGHFEATWSTHFNVTTPAYDVDGDPSTFSSGELNAIQEIWQRVSEDYAPFNIDVTTIDPGTQTNNVAAIIAIGGSSSDWYGPTAGGISFVGGFYNNAPNVGYAFSLTLGGTAKNVAEAAAHEAGHLFGLQHQSRWNGETLVEQYHSGGGGWAPIMGVSYAPPRTTWFNGATPFGSAILQDDLAVLAGANNGFGWRSDDYGNTLAAATPLTIVGNSLQVSGLIGKNDDQDVWSFSTMGGPASFQLTGAAQGTNLDAVLELRNTAGQTIALADPNDSYGATIAATLTSGNYYLLARSTGVYGSLGQYTVSGTVTIGAFPEITVRQGATTLADGQLVDFGTTPFGVPVNRVFTVQNDGTGPLTLSPLNPASLPAGYALEANLAQLTLGPGQSTTFAVRFTAATAGIFGGPLQLASNDADENPFDLALTGTVVVPDIALRLNAAPLTDGQSLNLGSATQGTPTTHTFTVLNEGTDALLLTPLDPAGFPSGFSLVTNLGLSALVPGQSTTFTIRVDAVAAGTFSGPLRLTSSDPDESPFDLNLTAIVHAPEIEVQLNSANLQDGQAVDFGPTLQGQPLIRTFTVTNAGSATLTLTPLNAASLPAGYSIVTNLGVTSLAPSQSTSFTVQLNALAGGNFTGPLQLASNDADENPFDLVLSGRVLAPDVTVLVDNVSLADGGTVDFGATSMPNPISRTFTVRNDGLASLTLTAINAASLPAGFTLVANLGITTLAPAQSTTFVLRLDAAAPGQFGGPLQVVSNDADENPFDLALTGQVTAPEITVSVNGTGVLDGGLFHFGNAFQGQPIDRTFTIKNDGAAPLMLATLNPATLPTGFALVANLGTNVLAPGQSTSFTLRLAASAAGSFGGIWALGNNDPDESPFDLQLAGTVTAPEIAVEVEGVGLADGGTIDFGTTTPGVPVLRHFAIRNEGAAPLSLTPLNASSLPPGLALVANQGVTTLAFGQSTSFILRLESAALGTFGGPWSLGSNDVDENPFDLVLTGRVAAAEIDVLLGGQSLTDGQAVSFGTAIQGQPVSYEFTVVNRGTAALDLVPLTAASLPAGLSLTSNIAQTRLEPNQAASFTLRLDATTPGIVGGEIALGSTDADENPFNLTFSGTVIAPEIVAELTGVSLTSGQPIDFGTTPRGTAVTRTFTIRNSGSSPLNLTPIDTGFMPAGFSLLSNPGPASLAPGEASSFAVRLDAQVAGDYSGTISLASNDADENPFRFVVSGRTTAPEITVRLGAAPLADGGAVDFGTTLIGQTVDRTLTIANDGQAVLNVAPLTAINIPAGFSLVSNLGATALEPGQATTFTLRLNATASGAVAGLLQLSSTDPDETPYDLELVGNVLAPEIRVELNGSELQSGATVDFGGTIVGLPADRTFTVQNIGTAALDLPLLNPASLPAGFAIVSNLAATTLAPGAAASFTLRLVAEQGGYFTGVLPLASSDADENPFGIVLQGSVSVPKIGVTLGGSPVLNGQTVDFGSHVVGAEWALTFSVHNLGSAPLVLLPLDPGDLPAGFSLATNLSQTNLPPGATTSFAIRFDATALGTFGGSIAVRSSDLDVGDFQLLLTGQVVGPELTVELDGIELADGQTIDFGVAAQGEPVVRTLIIRNSGGAPLTLVPLDPTSLPSGFSVATNVAPTLLVPGQSTVLALRFDATAAGEFSGSIALASDDADESPLTLHLTGSVAAPEITVLFAGAEIAWGSLADFGIVPAGGSSSRTFTVRNDGAAPLALTPLAPEALPAGFTIVSNVGATALAPGQSTSFTLRLGGLVPGSFSGTIELTTSDADESRFAIQLHGLLAAPEIVVAADGVELTAGEVFDWGDTLRGTPLAKTFTITNAGLAPLNLTPLNPAALPPGFILLSTAGATTLALGESLSFTLMFDAIAIGSFGGEVAIGSNDADENPFRLNFSARVIDPADAHVVIDLPVAAGDYTLDKGAGRMRLSHGAQTIFSRSLPAVASLTIHGTPSRESLTVSYAQGNPLPAGGVHFDAGDSPSGDLISLQGTAGQAIDWAAGDLAAGAGTLSSADGFLTYAGVRSLDFTRLSQARLQLANVNHALSIDAGFTHDSGLPALTVQGTAGGLPLPSLAFRENTTVAIASSGSAVDVVTLNGGANAHGNHNLSIDTGVSTGDRIDVTGAAVFVGSASFFSRQIAFSRDASSLSAAQIVLNAAADLVDASPGIPSVTGNELTAIAASGITLGTAAPIVRARVTGTGHLNLQSTGNATLSDVRTAAGAIHVIAAGTIAATSVASESLTPHEITLHSLAGSIAVGAVGTGTGAPGHVALTAAGSILPQSAGLPPVRATTLVLSAGADIGISASPLRIAAASLTAIATSGGIVVAALGDIVASASGAGDVSLSATGSLTASGGIHAAGGMRGVSLAAGHDLTIGPGSSVVALGDVRLAFGQDNSPAATATLAGQIVSVTDIEIGGGAGADRFVVPSPGVFAAPLVTLLGHAGSDSFVLQPQVQAPLLVYGGDSGGGPAGDLLDLDLTASAADPAATAIVSAALAGKAEAGSGSALTTGHGAVTFRELDGFLLRDQGVLTNLGLGSLYIRGSQSADIIEVGPAATGPFVPIRVNDQLLTLPVTTRTLLVGRGGDDTLSQSGVGLPVELRGEAGDDVLTGDAADDILIGGEGRDILSGLGGSDYLSGDTGDDALSGGAGNDRLFGGQGRDTLFGDDGDDVLAAGDGRDQLHGGTGHDVLIGGLGPDRLSGDDGDDLLISGRVRATGGSTTTTGYGDAYDLAMAELLADWSADGRLDALPEILSDNSSDLLFGGAGTDTAAIGAGDSGDWDQWLP